MVSYFNHIKEDPVKYEKERLRVSDALNLKYANDPEFRERRKEYNRLYKLRKKLEKLENEEQNGISN